MKELVASFSNREIAMSVWIGIIFVVSLVYKPLHPAFRKFFKTAVPILLCKKFLVFYAVFISYLIWALRLLKILNVWDYNYIKDTVFWVLFVELPLFMKAIETREGNFFFSKLIKENLKVIVVFEFFVNYWNFDIWVELLIVPISTFLAICSVIASQEKKYSQANKLLNCMFGVFGMVIFINALYNTIQKPFDFFNYETLKAFTLPIFLLLFNFPVFYGLALYSGYEQLFIRVKPGASHKGRMKLILFEFAGLNLSRVKVLRENLDKTIFISLNPTDLKANLQSLKQKLSLQIGDVYMKRSNFYLIMYVLVFVASLIGIILVNSEVSIKDLITFNFIIIVPRLKEILTYIFAMSVAFSFGAVIYFWGFRKKKYEEISHIKEFALHDFLIILKMQKNCIEDYPSFDNPTLLYIKYITNANQLSRSCRKVLDSYENLLSTRERERINSMYTYTVGFLTALADKDGDFSECSAEEFIKRYDQKVAMSPKSEDINLFHSILKRDLEKYVKKVSETFEDFSHYY